MQPDDASVTNERTAIAAPLSTPRPATGRRLLIIGWCFWLMGTWAVLWLIGGWTLPALRAMVFSGMIGMLGLWPAVRLSQPTGEADFNTPRPMLPSDRAWARVCRATFFDWVCLNLVFQAVIWPLQLATKWPLPQAIWLDTTIAGWSLLTGLLIAWGRGTDHGGGRLVAMLLCVGVVILEPGLWWLGWRAGIAGVPMMRLSPLQAIWGFTATDLSPAELQGTIASQGVQVISVTAAAIAGWIVLSGLLVWRAVRLRGNTAAPARAHV